MLTTRLGRAVCLMLGCAMMVAGLVLARQRQQERQERVAVNVGESLDHYRATTRNAQRLLKYDTPYRDCGTTIR